MLSTFRSLWQMTWHITANDMSETLSFDTDAVLSHVPCCCHFSLRRDPFFPLREKERTKEERMLHYC